MENFAKAVASPFKLDKCMQIAESQFDGAYFGLISACFTIDPLCSPLG